VISEIDAFMSGITAFIFEMNALMSDVDAFILR
jgi:hypothetical protein